MTTTLAYRVASHCVDAILRRQSNLTATLRTDLNDTVADLAIVRGVGAAAGRPAEVWDITSPDQQTIIRLIEVVPDHDIVMQLFRMHNGKLVDMGSITFRASLAAPLHVAEAAQGIAKAWIID